MDPVTKLTDVERFSLICSIARYDHWQAYYAEKATEARETGFLHEAIRCQENAAREGKLARYGRLLLLYGWNAPFTTA